MEASASGVNAPHVNDTTDGADPDDFFADDDAPEMDEAAQAEEAAAIERQAAEARAAEAERLAAAGAPTEAPTEVPTSADSSAEVTGDGSGETLPPVEQPGIPDTATAAGRAAAAAPEPTKASKDRPYVVLRELALTEETLTKLLEHVRSGADPIDVYLHVETVEARNDQHALKQVYAAHRERIGDRPRLVPVSKRAWRVRQVQPRQRVEEALEIV
jgi:hypothetical protein